MEDGKVRIDLNGEFTALELDEIIRDLAVARASTPPFVAPAPPSALTESEVLEQEEALFKFRTLVGGGLRIWLRNEGFGWLAFTLSPAQVVAIREFLGKQAGHSYRSH